MAHNDNQSSYRNSFVATEIQGHLEKKGVLGNRSKLWCSIQKSTLCMQKKHGSSMKTINLRDSHLVRKVATDVTGTHFEIYEKKKTHVFVCPTSENCTAWVRSLQAAMVLKDSCQTNPENIDSVYATVDENLNQKRISVEAYTRVSDYAQPYDVQNASSTSSNDNEYWEVVDAQRQVDKSQQATVQLISSSRNSSSTELIEADNVYSDATSETQRETSASHKQTVTPISPKTPPAVLRTSTVRKSCESKNYVSGETFKNVKTTDSHDSSQELQISDDGDDDDDDDNPFQTLDEALFVSSSPVPDFIHPLADEDWKPIEDLTQFLSSNQEFCQVSFSLVPIMEDPVDSLKTYLEKVGIVSTESSHI